VSRLTPSPQQSWPAARQQMCCCRCSCPLLGHGAGWKGTCSGFTGIVLLPPADPVQSRHQRRERAWEHASALCLLLGTWPGGGGEL